MTKWRKEDGAYLYYANEYTRLQMDKYNDNRGWSGYVLRIFRATLDVNGEPRSYVCVKYLNLNTKQLSEAKIKALDILQKYRTGELR